MSNVRLPFCHFVLPAPPISYNYPLTFYAVSNKFITFVPRKQLKNKM